MKKLAINFVRKFDRPRMANAQGQGVHVDTIAVPGTVVAASSRLHAVDVQLENGETILSSHVLSRQWVNDRGDAVTGRRNLPSVGSYVLVFFPDGRERPERTFVLGSFFPPAGDVPHAPFTDQDMEDQEYERSPAGWTEAIDRKTGRVDIQHDDGIAVTVNPKSGFTASDQHGNRVVSTNAGITIEDAHGNQVVMDATGVKLKTGDASPWLPNIIPTCPFTGAPHGGPAAGIAKLTGG